MAPHSNENVPSAAELISRGGLSHIAFIMDGNGRWAEKRGMPRRMGHSYGAKAFRRVLRYCGDIGLSAVTVYAFSTENWQRPEEEVRSIMKLLSEYIDECEKCAEKENLRVKFLGDLSRFEPAFRERMQALEKKTENYGLRLNIALNYGGRDEIVRAVNALHAAGKGPLTAEDISAALDTAGQPDPDLIVRTAGERRLSNFLLWQAAYAEFYYTDVLWPDLGPADIDAAVRDFYGRKRRFGKV